MNKQPRQGTPLNPNYITDRYGKLEVVIIPRDFEQSIQDEIIDLKEELLDVLDVTADTKVRQLQNITMIPNITQTINGDYSLEQCLRISFLLRGNTGTLKISPSSNINAAHILRPAGFFQSYVSPHFTAYYVTYIPENPLDTNPRVLEVDYIFNII
jgi:hypothetical protein